VKPRNHRRVRRRPTNRPLAPPRRRGKRRRPTADTHARHLPLGRTRRGDRTASDAAQRPPRSPTPNHLITSGTGNGRQQTLRADASAPAQRLDRPPRPSVRRQSLRDRQRTLPPTTSWPHAAPGTGSKKRCATTAASAAAQPLDRPPQRDRDATRAPNASTARCAANAPQVTPRNHLRVRLYPTARPHTPPRPRGGRRCATADAPDTPQRLGRTWSSVRAAKNAALLPTRLPPPNDLTARRGASARQKTPGTYRGTRSSPTSRPHEAPGTDANNHRATTSASSATQRLDRSTQRDRAATREAGPRTRTPSPNASAACGAATAPQMTARNRRRPTADTHTRPPQRDLDAPRAARPRTRTPSPSASAACGAATAPQMTARNRRRPTADMHTRPPPRDRHANAPGDGGRAHPPQTPRPHAALPPHRKWRRATDGARPLTRTPARLKGTSSQHAQRDRGRAQPPPTPLPRGAETTRQRTPRDDRRACCPLTAWRRAEPRPLRNRGRAPADEPAHRHHATAAASALARPRDRTRHPAPRSPLNGRRATTYAPAPLNELTALGVVTAWRRTPRNTRRVGPHPTIWPRPRDRTRREVASAWLQAPRNNRRAHPAPTTWPHAATRPRGNRGRATTKAPVPPFLRDR